MGITTKTTRGLTGPRGTTTVKRDGVVIGYVYQTPGHYVPARDKYRAETADGKLLGCQPRRQDAVDALVAFAASPFRQAHKVAE